MSSWYRYRLQSRVLQGGGMDVGPNLPLVVTPPERAAGQVSVRDGKRAKRVMV